MRQWQLGLGMGVALALGGCARPYDMQMPTSFRAYDESRPLKGITPDGVMLKVRTVDNYPKGSLEFWTEAMSEHLVRQGYALSSKRCFKTASSLAGCRLDFLLPHGSQDWVLSETVFVDADNIHLVEAAGPYDRFSKFDQELQQALLTFKLSG
ncbi:MAG TPA: hypothetical protein VHM70_31415 [Polyangiaceae bacterium]|jgi:hypothetical protein|nr:hypothetical protein [Polyangiaceae bacterium]